MMRLNMLPDYKRVTYDYPDWMVDENGVETPIVPRVCRYLGRASFTVGLSPAQGTWANVRVLGAPLWKSFYSLRGVKDLPREIDN